MKIDLNNLAGGATAEQINREIYNILANIKDPNTDQAAKRKLTITMTFVPDKNDSDIVDITTVCKAALVPAEGTGTRFVVGVNSEGKIEANEWGKDRMKDQISFEDRVVDEYGEIHEGQAGVIDLRTKKANI